jgi:hypothetical protein
MVTEKGAFGKQLLFFAAIHSLRRHCDEAISSAAWRLLRRKKTLLAMTDLKSLPPPNFLIY